MKHKIWFFIWGFILLACISVGIITRASYKDSYSNLKVLYEAPYFYSASNLLGNTTADSLFQSSQVVLKCDFDGKRNYANGCFLSYVTVTQVYKGGKNLKGQSIEVYEPICFTKMALTDFKKLPLYTKSKDMFQFNHSMDVLYAKQSIYFGSTSYCLMKPKSQYVLFLLYKTYPKEKNNNIEFFMQDNPYSKLLISKNPLQYDIPPQIISLGDSMNYEVLLQNSEASKVYNENKNSILKEIGI